MKPLIFALFLLLGGFCFYAGYELGKPGMPPAPPPLPPVTDKSPDVSGKAVIPKVSNNELPPLPPREQLEVPPDSGLAARAALRFITLIDREGREMVAEVLEAREDALRVRRRADYRVVDIPLDMLSPEDRSFAGFLMRSKPEAPSTEQASSSERLERGPDVTERDLVKLIRDQFSNSRF